MRTFLCAHGLSLGTGIDLSPCKWGARQCQVERSGVGEPVEPFRKRPLMGPACEGIEAIEYDLPPAEEFVDREDTDCGLDPSVRVRTYVSPGVAEHHRTRRDQCNEVMLIERQPLGFTGVFGVIRREPVRLALRNRLNTLGRLLAVKRCTVCPERVRANPGDSVVEGRGVKRLVRSGSGHRRPDVLRRSAAVLREHPPSEGSAF